MDTDGARRLNHSSPSCLSRRAQRTDFFHGLLRAGAGVAAVLLVWPVDAQQQPSDGGLELSAQVVQQVEALLAEKAARTPAQQKVSSHLLHAERIQRGEPIADSVVLRQSPVEIEAGGMVTVDIRADVTPVVLARIDTLGGSVINNVPQYRAIRARLPFAAVETLAELSAIQWIRPADEAVTRGRAQAVRTVARAGADAVTRKVNTSEGDVAHQADRARQEYGIDGTGIGIGVLSDGVDSLAARQASGDLPATVTVLPGQARPPASMVEDGETFDEGTAMLEIVHDLAPGADLYFATAFRVGQAQFAANIEALCAAGADVIVDDIGYFAEAVFQDDIVAQGVNAAVANGCVYFSAAGNSGNLNDGTSGVWEGDFVAGTRILVGGRPMGAALLRRAFRPLFMGICARGRSLLGRRTGGQLSPRLFSDSQGSQPGLITDAWTLRSAALRHTLDIRAAVWYGSLGKEMPLRWPS